MAAVTVRETERKFDATRSGELPALDDLPGVTGRTDAEEQVLDATYYDTSDGRLLQAGVTLRHRAGGDDAGWHLKLPAGGDGRDEIRVGDSAAGAPTGAPAELVELTTAYTRGAALRPVARIRTTRRQWTLTGADGQPLAEIADDRVSAPTMGTSASTSKGPVSWRELEVELKGGGQPALMDHAEQRLSKAGIRRSGVASKLARVLDVGSASGRTDTGRTDTSRTDAGAAVLRYLREQADHLRHYDPLVRQDAPDAVHRMRVALRRMRSALQVFGSVVDRDRTRSLTDELKWLAGELGQSRDLEVLQERFENGIRELDGTAVIGPVPARLTRYFARREADARAKVLDVLNGSRYRRLLDAVEELLADAPMTQRASRGARRELARSLRRAYRRMSQRMRRADQEPAGPRRDAALHEVRKAAKRMRYGLEVAEPTVGKPAGRLRKAVKAVQQVLGEHQDSVVARPVLREIGVQAHLDGENGFTYGLLHGAEAGKADRASQQLPLARSKLTPKKRRWLG